MATLQGQVAIITGGASGIGAASARRFVAAGARVVVADVQDDLGRTLAQALGPACEYRHCDVCREADMRALIDGTVERHGRLDCVFANAGVAGPGGPIESISPESWDAMVSLLLRSVYLALHFAAPVMRRQRSGCLISTASVAGLQAGYASHVYGAAKAAVIQLTRSVALELGEVGVRVNCICPGGIATPLFGTAAGLSPQQAQARLPALRTLLADLQPLRRAGRAEDVAEAALWLASDAAGFVNGHALVVDGGLACGRSWSRAQRAQAALVAALADSPVGSPL
jgi:NAD(P)-dependent dehydrogenase (short-subunit alcohol dehydrogenase family)